MSTVEVGCYACGAAEAAPYATENGFTLVKCARCGLLYVKRRPADAAISAAMLTGLHAGESVLDVSGAFDPQKVVNYQTVLADLFPAGVPSRPGGPLRWLDIGCGHGELLEAITAWSEGRVVVRGSEPNLAKQRSARARGLDVGFLDLESHDERYDVLSLLNVWSHIPDPVATLGRWQRLLVPGGALIIETGDSCHLASADHHRPFYLPDHLSFANETIVVGILERLGFEIVGTRKYRLAAYPKPTLPGLAKEALKLVWPGKRADFGRYFAVHPERDLYVHARLRA
jgi:SAM-dependent methyltransferase